jgi:hypothetical protein
MRLEYTVWRAPGWPYPESKSLHPSSESSDLPVTLSLDVSLWLPQKALSL